MDVVAADTLAAAVGARTAVGIAAELEVLIGDGTIPAGSRLPTIRDLAAAFGVSVGTVADAWGALRERGLVETRRRGGTHVVAPDASEFTGWASLDLLLASPDQALQPRMDGAIVQAMRARGVNAWGREQMVEPLRAAVAPRWPFAAEAWMTAGGGTEGLWLATVAAIEPGRPVAVEEPAPPGYLASLADLGVEVIGIPVDDDGPLPDALRAALDAGAAAFVHQPGGPFSTRHALSEARVDELVAVLEDADASIVEDDSLGPLSAVPVRTLGAALPHRTIRVLAFCRAYGLDLRTSVLGGAAHLVERAVRARSGGLASNSRILQHALAALLVDQDAVSVVDRARIRYGARVALASAAMRAAGLRVEVGPGSHVLWVEVPDESAAAIALSRRGIVVDVGATSFVTAQATQRLRISAAQLPEDEALLAELADLVARAASGALRVAFA
ncbi:aminotransferase class I/II-fold pyridoxal phosphate-dependent enzyme [Agrococcus jejuensis]|uniref:aminotransferase class I/II-fold pyridoxal phosphate-dependent enzyme n=1 Tax=Agrococcus jejuensis TaxID=399736 RepID=UPI001642F50E|nr:PLP-dependent aminotransferase family protein [Agrococcus jejuensis]